MATNVENITLTVSDNSPSITTGSGTNSPYYVGAEAKVEQTTLGAAITITDKHGTTTATVYDGRSIVSVTKTGTSGLVDTYTILFSDGTTTTYTVTNGENGTGSGTVTSVGTGVGLTGGTITSSGTLKANLVSDTYSTEASETITQTSGRQYAVNPDANGKLSVNVPWTDEGKTYTAGTNIQISSGNVISATDTTYESKPAASGGTAVSLVTTGEKYIWNQAESIPSKTSDLTNDSNFVADASYVHTDNNFTSTLKTKLNGIAAGAEVNVQSDWNQTTTTADDYIKNKPDINELKVLVVNLASFSSLPQTFYESAVTADHVCLKAELGTPSAQTGDWTVTTSAGELNISGSISGSTTATLYLAIKQ